MTACPKTIHKKKKKVKKKSQRKIGRFTCINLAKKIVRSKGKCEKCGRTAKEGWQLHGAHVIPVSYGHTAADTNNILCLCACCHSMGRGSMHDNPLLFAHWFNSLYPGRYETLWSLANYAAKVDWPMIYENLLIEAKEAGVKP